MGGAAWTVIAGPLGVGFEPPVAEVISSKNKHPGERGRAHRSRRCGSGAPSVYEPAASPPRPHAGLRFHFIWGKLLQ